MLFLFTYLVSFFGILYFFYRFTGRKVLESLWQPSVFILIYGVFCYYFTPSFDVWIWAAVLPLLYALFEDSLLGEFDIRFPLASVLFLNFLFFNPHILLFSLIGFGMLYLFAHFRLINDGEPFLILPFFFLIPVDYWMNFLFVAVSLGVVGLSLLYLFTKKVSLPFSFFLFLSWVIHLGYYQLEYPTSFLFL